jgi:uncharacterized protein (DUF2267 family)
MDHEEFVKRVQEAAALDSAAEAAAALEATLGTLGELLAPTERHHLAAQLHKPMKEYVGRWLGHPPHRLTNPHRFNLEEFYQRVSARSGLGYPAAVKASQAVIQVLRRVIAAGELAELFTQLPDDYGELLTGRPQTPASPSVAK